MFLVESSEGVDVAVHEFGGPVGGPPLLVSHATGFHAHCYEPVAALLTDRFRVFGLDYRGHGDTAAPEGWAVDWQRFGDDALAVARAIAPDGGLVGVGHSMGGAALFMAAHRDPDLFSRLVVFEPIAIPDGTPRIDMDDLPIVVGARRRRRLFASFDDAVENYRDKLPLSVMTPQALLAYVEHGFRPVDGGVELICPAEIEAGIFISSRDNGVWGLLGGVAVPTTVVTGFVDETQPSGRCAAIAELLPDAQYVQLDHQSHLGPFSHPGEFAELVLASVASATP
jgi:pimeloyl-ACP methyl ester carboxylesterase